MSQQQTLLKIQIPHGKELRGSELREMLAKDGGLPESFFHYQNGKPKSSAGGDRLQVDALPPICILSGRKWVGILGQPGTEELMDAVIGKAIRLVNSRVEEVCKAEVQNLELGCFPQLAPTTYWVREMVLKRRNDYARAADIETLVEERLKAGLERYAVAHGLILPTWSEMDLRVTKCDRPRGLAIRTTTGTTKEYATLVDVEFKAFVDLRGVWMVGNLTSRGYGRIGYFKENSSQQLKEIK